MALMIAAGLLLRGLYTTYTLDPGFDYRNVTYVSLQLGEGGYAPEEAAVLRQRFADEVAALPGVDAVAYATRAPLAGDTARIAIRLPGENESRQAEVNDVGPGYFSLLGIPIVRGRTFTDAEITNTRPAAGARPLIVSAATARNLWPGEDPIGRTLLQDDITLQVVGVAADAHVTALGKIDPYYVYGPGGASALLVRSRVDLGVTASSINAIARALDPALVVRALPLEANVAWWRSVSGIVTTLGMGLGALALALASVGIYGVVAYSVTRRYREIGIRMALGARAHNVLGLVLRRSMRPVVVGALLGLAAAAAVSGILSSVLFGVSPVDPVGLGGSALLVLGVALAASLMAARPPTRAPPTAIKHKQKRFLDTPKRGGFLSTPRRG
jgi:hypothetical protein